MISKYYKMASAELRSINKTELIINVLLSCIIEIMNGDISTDIAIPKAFQN